MCRKMVEKGVDIVVTQHSCCIGCYEEYKGGIIVYGQRNFIFNEESNKCWNTGLILGVSIENSISVEYIPIIRTHRDIRLANTYEADEIIGAFYKRSEEILDPLFVKKRYEEFAKQSIDNYLRTFAGFGKWLTRIDKHILKGLLTIRWYNRKQLLAIRNYIECEAHRELIIEGLKKKFEKPRKA